MVPIINDAKVIGLLQNQITLSVHGILMPMKNGLSYTFSKLQTKLQNKSKHENQIKASK